ncbi:fumarylacetoacetate hydrolase family protein [Frigidibacter oleivorans]|uniref:fumarylacetoacetate hydrolase family protein n=1 Tax=Frigidibacter oleivorans TaxID=2487129 RepID=UPI000F8EC1E2|nr:fumarylacetoacetate hydrolase family protein [Frigidibacter oleivorans]
MKLASFIRPAGAGFGVVADRGLVDLTGFRGHRSLRSLIRAGDVTAAADHAAGRSAELHWGDFAFAPVIPDPGKILCVGLNYLSHKKETGRPDVDHPTLFTRFADSQIGHRQPLVKPAISDRFDFEGELAVVIGTGGRCIPENRALDHIAGYSCYNDATVRDWQRHTFQFTPGKNFPGTGAFGPFLVTPDEVGDYRKLPIETRLNGAVVQKATLADLIFPIERLIAYISTFTPLAPGDVIVTGTPGGVGDKREPPLYMGEGAVAEVEIGMLGTLSNTVISDARP